MKKKGGKLPYGEGDWIAVPLQSGGFGVGVIARASKRGKVLFGYFFGPRLNYLPTIDSARDHVAQNAKLVAIFGDHSLYCHEWRVLGHDSRWDRLKWPMPYFSRVDERGKAVKVRYSEDDPSVCFEEKPCSIDEARTYLEDSMLGSHILAQLLDELLIV